MARNFREFKCQECEEYFEASRSDAKFCSTICKSQFHNRLKEFRRKERDKITKAANDRFWKNRNLLLPFIGKEATIEELEAAGFDMGCYTKKRTLHGIRAYYFYDVKCTKLGDGYFKIRD